MAKTRFEDDETFSTSSSSSESSDDTSSNRSSSSESDEDSSDSESQHDNVSDLTTKKLIPAKKSAALPTASSETFDYTYRSQLSKYTIRQLHDIIKKSQNMDVAASKCCDGISRKTLAEHLKKFNLNDKPLDYLKFRALSVEDAKAEWGNNYDEKMYPILTAKTTPRFNSDTISLKDLILQAKNSDSVAKLGAQFGAIKQTMGKHLKRYTYKNKPLTLDDLKAIGKLSAAEQEKIIKTLEPQISKKRKRPDKSKSVDSAEPVAKKSKSTTATESKEKISDYTFREMHKLIRLAKTDSDQGFAKSIGLSHLKFIRSLGLVKYKENKAVTFRMLRKLEIQSAELFWREKYDEKLSEPPKFNLYHEPIINVHTNLQGIKSAFDIAKVMPVDPRTVQVWLAKMGFDLDDFVKSTPDELRKNLKEKNLNVDEAYKDDQKVALETKSLKEIHTLIRENKALGVGGVAAKLGFHPKYVRLYLAEFKVDNTPLTIEQLMGQKMSPEFLEKKLGARYTKSAKKSNHPAVPAVSVIDRVNISPTVPRSAANPPTNTTNRTNQEMNDIPVVTSTTSSRPTETSNIIRVKTESSTQHTPNPLEKFDTEYDDVSINKLICSTENPAKILRFYCKTISANMLSALSALSILTTKPIGVVFGLPENEKFCFFALLFKKSIVIYSPFGNPLESNKLFSEMNTLIPNVYFNDFPILRKEYEEDNQFASPAVFVVDMLLHFSQHSLEDIQLYFDKLATLPAALSIETMALPENFKLLATLINSTDDFGSEKYEEKICTIRKAHVPLLTSANAAPALPEHKLFAMLQQNIPSSDIKATQEYQAIVSSQAADPSVTNIPSVSVAKLGLFGGLSAASQEVPTIKKEFVPTNH